MQFTSSGFRKRPSTTLTIPAPKRGRSFGFPKVSARNIFLRRRMSRGKRIISRGWLDPSSGLEKKFIDFTAGAGDYALAGTATTQSCCLIAQGSDANQRIGRKVLVNSIQLKYLVNLPSTATSGGILRTLVVYDKQPNATLAAVTDVVVSDSAAALLNLDNRDRFRTLIDDYQSISANGPEAILINRYLKVKLPIIYNSGTTAVVGAITTGNFIVLTWVYGVGTTAPAVNGRIRFRYVDL